MLFAVCGCNENENGQTETSSLQSTGSSVEQTSSTESGDGTQSSNTGGEVSDKTETASKTESKQETGDKTPSNSSDTASKNAGTTKPENKPTNSTTPNCSHKKEIIKNQKKATCTKDGYSGDAYCKDCGVLIHAGSRLPATAHQHIEVRGYKAATTKADGYTGDTYCTDCGAKVSSGVRIPKIKDPHDGKVEYILPNGTSVWLEPDADITGYYMELKTKKTTHLYLEVEKEIVRLCNIERAKVGAAPLEWFEDAYYFTKIRSDEAAIEFSHTRPNGKKWSTVYTDAGVHLVGYYGENLYESIGISIEEYAERAMTAWMNSAGHKKNILNPNFKRIAIAIVETGNMLVATQNFFS